jgi:glycerol-3-phosphate acyltransferase PlsY
MMSVGTTSSFVKLLRRNTFLSKVLDRSGVVLAVKAVGVVAILVSLAWSMPPPAVPWLPLLYLYGAIPFALVGVLVARRKRIESLGSGNVSVSNAFRSGGYLAGCIAVVGEVSKALLPILISWLWFDYRVDVAAALLFCAILGEYVSPYLQGSGGFAGTIMIWSFAILAPLSMLLGVAAMLGTFALSRDRLLMVLAAFWSLPLILLLIDGRLPLVLLALGYAILFSLRISPERNDFSYVSRATE